MIKKISVSEKDIKILRELSPAISDEKDATNYQGIVIQKPWGYEYLVFENENCAVWLLSLIHGGATSLHCHPRKKTSLTVLGGEIQFKTLNEEMTVKKGEGLFIDKGVFHSSKAISSDGAVILETETPNNKKDLIRLLDNYGREGRGYEGKDAHEQFHEDLVSFHAPETRYNTQKLVGSSTLTVVNYSNPESLKENIKNHPARICVILSGNISGLENRVFHEGEIIAAQNLRECEILSIIEKIELLLIH